ncbi:hypothetical protein KVT40_005303 [Elsinoe batatas]|uniref:Uncharacterized protein n=1 Tax=Elsinoe batatas TaxID=2601811 RepID=A0A8K0L190_9PEZI|nr:hypothetical protein KVT40_005303 [Elsinoe batatas]
MAPLPTTKSSPMKNGLYLKSVKLVSGDSTGKLTITHLDGTHTVVRYINDVPTVVDEPPSPMDWERFSCVLPPKANGCVDVETIRQTLLQQLDVSHTETLTQTEEECNAVVQANAKNLAAMLGQIQLGMKNTIQDAQTIVKQIEAMFTPIPQPAEANKTGRLQYWKDQANAQRKVIIKTERKLNEVARRQALMLEGVSEWKAGYALTGKAKIRVAIERLEFYGYKLPVFREGVVGVMMG